MPTGTVSSVDLEGVILRPDNRYPLYTVPQQPAMVGSFFNPSPGPQVQSRPTSTHRLPGTLTPTGVSPYQNRFSPLPKSSVNPALKKPLIMTRAVSSPNLTKTTSTPSTTTAPMFPDEILINLYISDLETARAVLSPNYNSPGRPRIKYVLTLLDNAKEQPQAITTATTNDEVKTDNVLKLIKLSDYNDVNILQILPEACTFIRASLQAGDGGVLVHCRKGISRSGSVVVAYLMQELRLGFEDALQKAKGARSKIWPNRGFTEQLKMWRDLDYTLVDENGREKTQYTEWRAKARLRPEVWEF